MLRGMKSLLAIIAIPCVFLLVLNVSMFLRQPAMTFFPARELVATPTDWGLEYTDVYLRTEDAVNVHGWYIPKPGADRALLFLHGNGGNISHRGDSIEIFHRLGFHVLIIDYRGYGLSAGHPGEAGLYRDAAAAWNYLRETAGIPAQNIVIFGRSLGGAVAAQLAAEVDAGALILESTFSSARDFAAQVFPVLSRVLYLRYGFDTVARLQRVDYPVLVLHSPDDDIIPFALGRKVYDAAQGTKHFVTLRGDHNSGFLMSQPGYEAELRLFIDRHLQRSNPDIQPAFRPKESLLDES